MTIDLSLLYTSKPEQPVIDLSDQRNHRSQECEKCDVIIHTCAWRIMRWAPQIQKLSVSKFIQIYDICTNSHFIFLIHLQYFNVGISPVITGVLIAEAASEATKVAVLFALSLQGFPGHLVTAEDASEAAKVAVLFAGLIRCVYSKSPSLSRVPRALGDGRGRI